MPRKVAREGDGKGGALIFTTTITNDFAIRVVGTRD